MSSLIFVVTLVTVSSVCAQTQIRPLSRVPDSARTSQHGEVSSDSEGFRPPVLGYVVRPAPIEVRAILGVPGASNFSEAIELPSGAEQAVFAPGHSWAIVFREGGVPPLIWSPDAGELATLNEVESQADIIAFSPSGNDVALYWRREKRLVRYSVDSTGVTAYSQHTQLPWPENLQGLALSDGGTAFVGQTKSGKVLLLSTTAPDVFVYESARLAGVTFLAESEDFVVVDSFRTEVHLFEHARYGYASRLVLDATAGVERLGRLVASEPGLVVGSDGGNLVWSIEIATGQVHVALARPVTTIQRLRIGGLFLVSERAEQAAWLLSRSEFGLASSFVPALAASEGPLSVEETDFEAQQENSPLRRKP